MDVADRAGLVWVSADRRLAQELEKLPKATGTRGQLRGPRSGGGKGKGGGKGTSVGGSKVSPPTEAAPTLRPRGR
jgi:hypothetical protein